MIIPNTGLVNSYDITAGLITDSVYKFKLQATNVLGVGSLSEAS